MNDRSSRSILYHRSTKRDIVLSTKGGIAKYSKISIKVTTTGWDNYKFTVSII